MSLIKQTYTLVLNQLQKQDILQKKETEDYWK